MTSSILFQPLPFSRPKGAPIQQGLSGILGGAASQAVSYSQQCRAAKTQDLSCFPQYVIILSALANSQLDTEWTNPFNSQNIIKDNIAQAEILNTLWNYICTLHLEILNLNASDKESLKKMKARIGDAMAASEEMGLYTSEDEPVFTPRLVDFLIKYHEYLNYAWQLAIIQEANKPIPMQIKSMIGCMKAIEAAQLICEELPDRASSFCEPVCRCIQSYYLANIRLSMGDIDKKALEYGYAIASYKEAWGTIQNADKIAPWAPQVTATVVCMKNAVRTSLAVAEKENKEIYHVYSIPQSPPLGAPQKLIMIIEPTDNLFGHPRNTNPGESYPDLPDVDDSGNLKPSTGGMPPPGLPPGSPPGGNDGYGGFGGNGGNGGIPAAGMPDPEPDFTFDLPEIPTGAPPGFQSSGPSSTSGPPTWTPPPGKSTNFGGNSAAPPPPSAGGPPVWTPPPGNSAPKPAPKAAAVPPWMMSNSPFDNQNANQPPAGGPPPWAGNASIAPPPSSQPPTQPPNYQQNQQSSQQPQWGASLAPPPAALSQGFPQSNQTTGFPEWNALMDKKKRLVAKMTSLATHPVYGSDVQRLMANFNQADQSDGLIQQIVDAYLAGDRSRTEDEIKGLIGQADGFYSALENRLAGYQ